MTENKESRREEPEEKRSGREEKKAHGSSNKGLAAADKETRERVAGEGGKTSQKGGHGRNEKKRGDAQRDFPLL